MYCAWSYHPHNLDRAEATREPNFHAYRIEHALEHDPLAYLNSCYSKCPCTCVVPTCHSSFAPKLSDDIQGSYGQIKTQESFNWLSAADPPYRCCRSSAND